MGAPQADLLDLGLDLDLTSAATFAAKAADVLDLGLDLDLSLLLPIILRLIPVRPHHQARHPVRHLCHGLCNLIDRGILRTLYDELIMHVAADVPVLQVLHAVAKYIS